MILKCVMCGHEQEFDPGAAQILRLAKRLEEGRGEPRPVCAKCFASVVALLAFMNERPTLH